MQVLLRLLTAAYGTSVWTGSALQVGYDGLELNVYPKNDSRAVIDSYKPLINSREMLPRILPIAGCGLRSSIIPARCARI